MHLYHSDLLYLSIRSIFACSVDIGCLTLKLTSCQQQRENIIRPQVIRGLSSCLFMKTIHLYIKIYLTHLCFSAACSEMTSFLFCLLAPLRIKSMKIVSTMPMMKKRHERHSMKPACQSRVSE